MSDALRHNAGKIKMSYAPACLSRAAARGFEYGANKYARDNWRKGFPYSTVIDSLTRHLDAWREGEDIDAESGLSHVDLIACNVAMLADMIERGTGTDDRSRIVKKPDNDNTISANKVAIGAVQAVDIGPAGIPNGRIAAGHIRVDDPLVIRADKIVAGAYSPNPVKASFVDETKPTEQTADIADSLLHSIAKKD